MIKSKSSVYFQTKDNTPTISAIAAKKVSSYRRDKLAEEVESGLFKEGSGSTQKEQKSFLGNVIGSGSKKFANFSGNNFKGDGGVQKQSPEIYSPLWLTSNLSLPRDKATINAWCRSFYALNPYVRNAINLHSTYPISKLNIKCKNKDIEKFFNDMIEEIDLMNICVQIAQEYWLLGEAFVYAELDNAAGKWSRLVIQNPDYMLVQPNNMTGQPDITIRPDEHLKNIVFSNKAKDIEQRRNLNPIVIDAVRKGQNIPVNPFNISHLSLKTSPYELRGTGLPVCIFRQLSLFDKLRESKFAQADNLINPLTLVKIGSAGADGFKPQYADLEAYREQFEQAYADKNFRIFTHDAVTVEPIGFGSGIYDISGDVNQLVKEIYVGLMVPSVLIEGGDGTTYANGGVALDTLRQRYIQFRNMLSIWLKRKIFAPISKIQEFYDYEDGEKKLIVPEIDWNHMSLFDVDTYIQNLMTLADLDKKRVSLSTLYRSLGLEFEDEVLKMRKEAIQQVIHEKEVEALKNMNLNELRALDNDSEILETDKQDNALPGEELPGEKAPDGLDLSMPPPSGAPEMPKP